LTAPEFDVNNAAHEDSAATGMRHPDTRAMRRRAARLLFAGALCVFAASGSMAAGPMPGHPILGAWTFTVPDGGCEETYEFRPDGTLLASSGEARSERTYRITDAPDAQGFYRLVDKVVRENGKLDCFGEPTEPGSSATIFILFDPGGDRFVACESESPDACLGPLLRIRREET
jgi:hypothetical protein